METNFVKDKTILITGATSGIGLETSIALSKMGAKVVIVGRSQSKGESAYREIIAKSANTNVEVMLVDLSSLAQVRKLAEDFKANHSELHVLINNAGLMPKGRELTVDGIEAAFSVNFLTPFLLTNLLLPVLKASSPSRIINIVTRPMVMGRFNFNSVEAGNEFAIQGGYAQSKTALLMFTYALAKRLEGTNVDTVGNSVRISC